VTKNKPEETSSDDSHKNRPEPDETLEIEETWYHESSKTESDALRSMIGGKDKGKDDNDDDDDESEDSENEGDSEDGDESR
jgi:hypothetical protein